MKDTLKHLLIPVAVVAAMFCVLTSAGVCRAQSLPDLKIRGIRVTGDFRVAVSVANNGHAPSYGCYVILFVLNPGDKKALWQKREPIDPLSAGGSVSVTFDTQGVGLAGRLLMAVVDSTNRVKEENEANNGSQLLVPSPAKSIESPLAPPPEEQPKLSPDIAVVKINYANGVDVLVVLKNVGDRDYHALDAAIKDSFKRAVTLKRIVHTDEGEYTQVVGTRLMGDAPVGETFQTVFKYPKKVAEATKYTWIATIEGEDPNMKNNTLKKVSEVTKID